MWLCAHTIITEKYIEKQKEERKASWCESFGVVLAWIWFVSVVWYDVAARAQIMKIHSRKMRYDENDKNLEQLARSTEDFNGAQMKAMAVEAGMIALRRESSIIKHEHYMEVVVAVKKKGSLDYYA